MNDVVVQGEDTEVRVADPDLALLDEYHEAIPVHRHLDVDRWHPRCRGCIERARLAAWDEGLGDARVVRH